MSRPTDPSPRGWVLYDDSCGFCRSWVPGWAGTLARLGLAVAPLQSEWVGERLAATAQERFGDLWILMADGRQIRGADAYRYVLRGFWWSYPLYLLSVTPLLRQAFNGAYRKFADRRHRFSSACGLSPGGRGAGPGTPGS